MEEEVFSCTGDPQMMGQAWHCEETTETMSRVLELVDKELVSPVFWSDGLGLS